MTAIPAYINDAYHHDHVNFRVFPYHFLPHVMYVWITLPTQVQVSRVALSHDLETLSLTRINFNPIMNK